jgi:membrane protease YdiL (CAAX protease family)
MKKILITTSLVFALSILGFVNFVYPFISILYPSVKLDLKVFQYYFVLASYFCLALILWFENNELEVWNLEKYSIFVLIVMSFIRIKLNFVSEEIFRHLIPLLGLLLLIGIILYWKKVPGTSTRWALFGLGSCVLVLPLAFIESTVIEKYTVSSALYQSKFFSYAVHNLLYTLAFVAPYEELVLRGVLWGQLRRWNIDEIKIVWIQGLLTWLFHFWQITNPITFFITIPIQTIVLTVLVKNSRQIFPSIVSHTLTNLLLPIVISLFFYR